MHHIQQKILNRLLYTASLGYAQMRPPGVESNHFAYHLDQLLRAGLIAKDGRQYFLTTEGLALADRLSHDTLTIRVQPHIVTSMYVTNDVGQILVYKHAFQPYLNLIGPPQGRVHYEEHIADAARRELREKTGLADVPLMHRGMAYIHTTKDGADVSKILAHIFTGSTASTPELLAPTNKGSCKWANVTRLSSKHCMPGFKQVLKLLASSPAELFFTEIETTLG